MARAQQIFKFSQGHAITKESLLQSNAIPEQTKIFFKALLLLAEKQENTYVSRKALQEYLKKIEVPASDGTMRARISELLDAGSAIKVKGVLNSVSVDFIDIGDFGPLDAKYSREELNDYEERSEVRKRSASEYNYQLTLFAKDPRFLNTSNSEVGYAEGITQIVDCAMPLSPRSKEHSLTVEYPIGNPARGEVVTVKARTLAHSSEKSCGLMVQTDKRVVNAVALMSIELAQRAGFDLDAIQNGTATEEHYKEAFAFMSKAHTFDIYDLAANIGFSGSGSGGAEEARAILTRIRETVYDLEFNRAPKARERFDKLLNDGANPSNFSSGMMEFRFFTTFKVVDEYDKDPNDPSKTIFSPRWYSFQFHPEFIISLLRGKFLAHKGYTTERSGIAHKVGPWFRTIFAGLPNAMNKELDYRIDELWARTLPWVDLKEFDRYLQNLLERECVSPDGWDSKKVCVSRVYGFYVKYDPDTERSAAHRVKRNMLRFRRRREYPILTISVDRDDTITGINSFNNKRLRSNENNRRQTEAILKQQSKASTTRSNDDVLEGELLAS